jgi:hypothetical protein
MKQVSGAIERLGFAIRTLPGVLSRFSETESEQRPSAERWTKKEVLGHLIDSASNNHQRFVRGQITAGQEFPGQTHQTSPGFRVNSQRQHAVHLSLDGAGVR